MKFNTLKYTNAQFNLNSKELIELRNKTALDLSFQSSARWPDEVKTAYMTSLITGMAPSKIILCNVKECKENCIEGSEDWKYFDYWDELGYDYISIDGNNRTITINQFLNDEVTIKKGDYTLPSGAIVNVDETCNTFSTLKKAMRKYVDEVVQVSYTAYINATRYDMTQLFLNINDGVSLNAQEKLNAELVPFSSWVRERVAAYYPVLKMIFPTENQLVRRVPDDFVVSLAVYATFGTEKTIQSPEKKKAYQDDSAVSRSTARAKKNIEETINLVKKYADEGFKNSSTFFNLYMLVTHILDENMKIKDEKEFFNWFIRTENRLTADDTPIMTTSGGESRTYGSCNSTMSSPELTARKDKLLEEFDLNCIGKIVVQRDGDRFFTPAQKYKLWQQQNGVCPRTGKVIPEEEINNHKKWHADHIIPHDMGGPTVIENGELVDAVYNLKKGNRWSDTVGTFA